MKKKYLAASLSLCMILTSCMLFAAGAESVETGDKLSDSVYEEAWEDNTEEYEEDIQEEIGDEIIDIQDIVSEESVSTENIIEPEEDTISEQSADNTGNMITVYDDSTESQWIRAGYKGTEFDYEFYLDSDNKTLTIRPVNGKTGVEIQPGGSLARGTGWVKDGSNCTDGIDQAELQSVEKVVLEEGITKIGSRAFKETNGLYYYKSLKEVILPDSLTEIESNAFENNPLQTIDLKNTKILGVNAFQGCKNLAKISFGNPDLQQMGYYALNGTSSLQDICFAGTREAWDRVSSEANIKTEPNVHCKGDKPEAKEAACEESGVELEKATCQVCGEEYAIAKVLEPLGHEYETAFTEDKKATCTKAGEKSRHCIHEGCTSRTDIQTIPADKTNHSWGNWNKTKDATVFWTEQQERTCTSCNKKETRITGRKLTAKASVNVSSVTLKEKQSTDMVKVSGLAKGDSVKSWNSTNTKVFTVAGKADGSCKLIAVKKGTANLEITMASGLKKTIAVKVQKKTVTTANISGLSKRITVKKGKTAVLSPIITPATSQQKITYSTSNKKIATVSGKGVITAKKAGTAKITVKSGKKKVVVTVTVPKTKTSALTVAENVLVKKGKTYRLRAIAEPSNTDEKITYSTSNKKIATVNKSGKIKGIKKGTATITVKSGKVIKKVKVTVK